MTRLAVRVSLECGHFFVTEGFYSTTIQLGDYADCRTCGFVDEYKIRLKQRKVIGLRYVELETVVKELLDPKYVE